MGGERHLGVWYSEELERIDVGVGSRSVRRGSLGRGLMPITQIKCKRKNTVIYRQKCVVVCLW